MFYVRTSSLYLCQNSVTVYLSHPFDRISIIFLIVPLPELLHSVSVRFPSLYLCQSSFNISPTDPFRCTSALILSQFLCQTPLMSSLPYPRHCASPLQSVSTTSLQSISAGPLSLRLCHSPFIVSMPEHLQYISGSISFAESLPYYPLHRISVRVTALCRCHTLHCIICFILAGTIALYLCLNSFIASLSEPLRNISAVLPSLCLCQKPIT